MTQNLELSQTTPEHAEPTEQDDAQFVDLLATSDSLRKVIDIQDVTAEPLTDEKQYEYSPDLYINLRADEAIAFAEANGHNAKVARRDGLHLDVNDGIDQKRLKFTVRDGYVTAVRVG